MKESIGNSYLFGMVIALVGILFLILIGSLSYSKAFKVKTRIIEIIEKNNEYNEEDVKTEIDNYLKTAGYTVTRTNNRNVCAELNGTKAINTKDKNYDYCIYRFDTVKGPYYHVTVFISFDIPVISTYLKIPVSGETKVIYELKEEGEL